MNRRGFIATAGAFAGLGLLPSWRAFKQRRQIDLTPFCGEDHRYSLGKPFAQDGMVYATDARIVCRTTLADAPALGAGVKLPGASALPWWREDDLHWKRWPKLKLFADGDMVVCPMCYGNGCSGGVRECPDCCGFGDIEWMYCKLCQTSGKVGDIRCDYCDGLGMTRKPALQSIGSLVVAGHYDRRVRGLGDVEYAIVGNREVDEWHNKYRIVKFRGDGFEGLLMPLVDRGGA